MNATNPKFAGPAAQPVHVAIIMDGNGRWAKQRGLPRTAGHRAGVKSARRIVERMGEQGVEYLTLFAFSSENWQRPREEVGALMTLFSEVLKRETDDLDRNNVRLRFIGDRKSLGRKLGARIADAERRTEDNTGLKLNIAIAYGGRWEIVEAVREIAEKAQKGELVPADVDEAMLESHLALADCPDPDLLVRTGGEQRISNFLLWELAYAEIFFSETLWPDFSDADVDTALEFFCARQRRYGRTGEQIEAQPC